jgi:hypothetical protein
MAFVMAGLDPAIHVLESNEVGIQRSKTWMPGIKPGMTRVGDSAERKNSL